VVPREGTGEGLGAAGLRSRPSGDLSVRTYDTERRSSIAGAWRTLAFNLEADFQGHLEFFNLSLRNAAT
jgi:hypothetical protein